MRSLAKILAVATKELRQIRRDRRTLAILLLMPAILLLLYGYALNFDIRNIRLAVQDRDRTTASREVMSAFVNSGYFMLVDEVLSDDEITGVLDRGDARAVLVIPDGFGRDTATGRPSSVQLIISGDNANTATTVMGYGLSLIGALSARYEMRTASLPRSEGPPVPRGPMLTVEPRVWYNPELRSTIFLVPGLIAYIAMLTGALSTALSVVREKEAGTMEQVRMSPISPLTYVVGKTVPYFFVSFFSSMAIVGLSMVLFGLPMRGSWVLLLSAVALFVVSALALGLLVSTVAETQQVALQVALLATFLPTLILSGFIFPIMSMPTPLQVISTVVPAKYFVTALRGIVLKGVGIDVIGPQFLALVAFAAALLALASLRLRREWA
jgi:ABC-2 type transport system permease protein